MTPSAIVSLLLEVSWRSVLIAALVGGVLLLWRVKGGAARHAAWTVVMVAMLLMPALLAIAPEWQVPVRVPVVGAVAPIAQSGEAGVEPMTTMPSVAGEVPATRAAIGAPVDVAVVPVARQAAQVDEPDQVDWAQVAILVWLAGIAVNVVVMAVGWQMARRLVRGARTSEIDPRVLESPAVSAPCAVGVWNVSVVVPRVWRTWSRAGRDAVLQHEFAHVRRRDLFVAFLTRLNRAVFWFNPIAWWLERRIAVAAEQACDEAVLLSGQDPQRYAAVLVEMAGALRSGGGRVAWQSIGMADGGDLESRVDRVLTGEVPRLSRWRAVGVMGMSAAALVVAVACQQAPAPAPAPLQEDPVVAENIRRNQERTEEFLAAQKMSLAEAKALAAQFEKDSNDLPAARKLLTFYRDRGPELMGWNEMVAARRALLLTLIEQHPEAAETYWPITRRLDPEGYDRARAAWLAQTAKPAVTPRTLGNAASFFRAWEPEVAERLLLKAESIDAGGPSPRVANGVASTGWRGRLGELYAYWVVGATEENLYNTIQAVSAERAATPFAVHARRTLDASTDPRLLGSAGTVLFRSVPWAQEHRQPSQRPEVLPFDPIALGRSYMERALAADPSLVHLQRNIAQFDRFTAGRATLARAKQLLGVESSSDASLEAIAGLPADLRLELLPGMTDGAFNTGEMREYYQKDMAGRDEFFKRARALAEQSLALAAEMPDDPRSPGLRYAAHMVRGVVSLREGDQRQAVSELTAAADAAAVSARPVDELATMASQKLPQYLLTHGERESVASFYERTAPHSPRNTESWTKAAAAIRAGKMPEFYQYNQSRR